MTHTRKLRLIRNTAKKSSVKAPKSLLDAREVIEAESRAVLGLLQKLNGNFSKAIERILASSGHVIVTGLGKSGLVGQKISATLASTGTPSLFLHAAEAAHGDLGRITQDDIVLALSNSGESDEILRVVRPVKSLGAYLIALTGQENSSLARHADLVLTIGNVAEACPMGLVPTASTTAMMVLGDALAMTLFNRRGFGREEYARYHPGGDLGRKLLRVEEVMRRGDENPVVPDSISLQEALVTMSQTKGRPGAVSVVNKNGILTGFFTDGDLRRLVQKKEFSATISITKVMHRNPKSIRADQLVVEAAQLLRQHKIDQVPVVDAQHHPVGLIDIQDLLSTRIV